MNKFKFAVANYINKHMFQGKLTFDANPPKTTGKGGSRELSNVQRFTFKAGTESDFESPDNDFADIKAGYATDSYIRQGIDKYVDQIFKEGYSFFGNDETIVEYIKTRLSYIAEATGTPTNGFLIEIAEDLVKFGNCMIVKARGNEPNNVPQGINLQGIYGGDPVVGYFVVDPASMKCKRDEFGTVIEWQQESDNGTQKQFKPEDVIHMYYKRERGNAYGTSFLIPVLDDVRALRQAEENVLKMMYRYIYPFFHVAVGSPESPGTQDEVDDTQTRINNMDLDGGLVTSERVQIKPIASDQVIEAEPYLRYMEDRVFSGMGIPAIMFGRGDTSNRSTGDNMTSEMADRIRAICKIIEMFVNEFILKELLMEGGYDAILDPNNSVQFRFNDNDVDIMIKKEVHAIYKYEHNSITEDEMRKELGRDPIPDGEREKMFVQVITRTNMEYQASVSGNNESKSNSNNSKKSKESGTGTKETNNKQKNSGGRKSSKDRLETSAAVGLIKDSIEITRNNIDTYLTKCYDSNCEINQSEIWKRMVDCNKNIIYTIESKGLSDNLVSWLDRYTISLCDNVHKDFIGTNTMVNTLSDMKFIVGNQLDIFKDSLLDKISRIELDRKDDAA